MPRRTGPRDARPSLGYGVIDWMVAHLAMPDRTSYEPFKPYPEQARFILEFYELDPLTGRRIIRRAVLSRPRGWGKSPLLAAIAWAEALGPVRFDGWDARGRPVGRPWASERTPLVQVAAVAEPQTRNTWAPLLEMAEAAALFDAYPGVEPMGTFVNLPQPQGRIEKIASAARTEKGARAVFSVLDQTEEWVASNGGHRLAAVMRVNAAKVDGTTIESPNAYVEGEDSVAERSAATYRAIIEGRTTEAGLLWDHREAPPDTDMADPDSLRRGLAVAYGDSADCNGGHVNISRLMREIADLDVEPERAQLDYLNQIGSVANTWLTQPEWAGCLDATKVLSDGDAITLGFDGSRGRAKGKPDATALVGCRVSDGYVFELGVWEAPERRDAWAEWTPPIVEIDAALTTVFLRLRVVAFYADPAKDWRSYVNGWEARWGTKLAVQVTRDHPCEWWMSGGRAGLAQRAIESAEGAVRNRDLSHDGSWALTRHVLHARRRIRHGKLSLAKESDYSPKKIDAAVAMVLAWQARLDAMAAGVAVRRTLPPPARLR